jgi:membrane protein YqaA with SNARE-associated domain
VFSDFFIFFQELANQIITHPLFATFGTFFVFVWTVIPSAKSLPVEILSFPLLETGVSPVVLVLMAWGGAILGDYILYLAGRGIFHVIHKKSKELAKADHLLHKYRFIFLVTPFLGVIGDTIVFVAGLERIGFRRLLPFILIGHFIRFTVGMIALMGIIMLPEFLGI